MKNNIIDGKKVSEEILLELKNKINSIQGRKPGLAVILVGADPASEIYVRKKVNACKKLGIISNKIEFSEEISEKELLKTIDTLNNDNYTDGILVQLPLPKHINQFKIIDAISPEKDVDGFHPLNIGKRELKYETLSPCTPKGIIRLLEYYNIDLNSKNITVVGRSNIVGKPLASMLLNKNATITVCHRATKNLKEHTINADIVATAVGKPNLITADMVKDGVIIVDIGMNRVDGKICGDVDFENVSKKASLITPVPGGVGPMTIAMLMENTLLAHEQRNLKKESGN